MIIEFGEFLGSRADLIVAAITQNYILGFREQQKSRIIADRSNFCPWPMPQGDNSRRGPVFDVEFAQNVFDVLADRPGACAEDHADLMIRFTLCDPSQNLRFARGETQYTTPFFRRH